MKILFSGFKDLGHSKFGGYHQIINMNVSKKILLIKRSKKITNKFLVTLKAIYLELLTQIFHFNYDITHFFYADVTKSPKIGWPKLTKHKTIVTIHLDPEQHHHRDQFLQFLRKVDGIIVMSYDQKISLKKKYGLKSEFIPHGFYQPQFKEKIPLSSKGETINFNYVNLITVGSQYRDFVLLKNTIKKLSNNINIKFHIVGAPQYVKDWLSGLSNTLIYDRISDDELYTLISKSDFGFLPLTYASANNSLLEFQYLNLNSILPNIGGILDYAAPAPHNKFYNNFDELISIISQLKKPLKSSYLNNYAKSNFDWHIIFEKILKYYNDILSR